MSKEYHKRKALNTYRRYKKMQYFVASKPWVLQYGGAAAERYKAMMGNALTTARHHYKVYRTYP